MIRTKLSRFLAAAAVKVAANQTPEYVKAQLKQRHQALTVEVNEYCDALSRIFTSK
jgi:hypothetical protein